MATTPPPWGYDLFYGPHGERYIAEWLTGLNLLRRKQLRRRDAMRPQGPSAAASNEALANVLQRLPPKAAAACRAVCLRWYVLLSSPRLAGGCFTCFDGPDGVSAAGSQVRHRRRRGDDTMPAAARARTLFAPLPKHKYRRTKKKQGYRRMF
ncbi:hypothetical protein HU200_063263 [Digitaria exilis]|uniref:F-box domain-containing protein n=1 Tax=Digitaria exilis TaxID=1010633 RepID=A0A835A455_9POAL|nr:hypothetical protein HU200_063263 [Digitaria exilis]